MRLGFYEWEKPFETEKDGVVIGLDAFKVHKWFQENAPLFPEEFEWLLQLYKSWDEQE